MLKTFACCGTSCFKRQEEADPWNLSKPRRSWKCCIPKIRKSKNNTLGLDAKKGKAYAEMGSPRTSSSLRFQCWRGKHDYAPIVVKHKQQQEAAERPQVCNAKPGQALFVKGRRRRDMWRDESHQIFSVILIILCLVLSGKTFAIVCICVSWFLLPVVKQYKLSLRKFIKNSFCSEGGTNAGDGR